MRNDIASPTAQPIHWISTLILVEEAAAMGVPLSTALRGTRITPEQLGEPGVTITVIDQMRIIINVARALPDQPIGLNWGRLLDIHSFQTFGLWVCAHATLGELLDAVLRYQVMLNAVVVGRGSFVGPHYRLELHYPPAAMDYVVMHELCHLQHMDHGPGFHALMDARMPDWRQRKQLLDQPLFQP